MTPVTTVQRLGVIDSGETAVRVLNAVGGLNDAGDAPPITTVLFHDEPDPQPWYGREADEVKPLCENVEQRSIDDVVACLRAADVDTLWLGSWPGEERADLIGACAAAGIGVVGPDADTVRRLSDPAQLPAIGDRAALLDGRPLRRVEVDFLADDHGTVWNLGGRDVSVRRSHHSLVAEAPCAAVSDELATAICAAASDLARDVGYRGAGMVTFVHDHTDFAISAVDCIAPPDHATSEERSGASFIGWRLRVHRGEALPEQEPAADGVAMEVRLLAEDPDDGFTVTPGRVALLSFPVGTGVRVDANRRVGDRVDETDSLLAIITAWGPDRSVALTRIRRALERTGVVIDEGTTNLSFLLALLDNEQFQRDEVDHRWLDRMIAERPPPEPDPMVLLAAAVEAYEADRRRAQEAFYASAERGRPQQPDEVGAGIELGYLGESYRLDVDCVAPRTYSVRSGRTAAHVTVDRLNEYERRVTCAGRRHRLVVSPTEFGFRLQVGHASHVIQREDGVLVRAGWPALIVGALVQPGDVVAEGEPIVVLESMKMETTVVAPFAGVVLDLLVTANSQVERGAALLRLRPQASTVAPPAGRRVDLSGFERSTDFSRKPCDRVYEPLGDYLLGYDLAPAELRRLLTEQRRLAEIADAADPSLLACEDGLLDIFAELGSLYRPQTEVEHDDLAPSSENTQEYLVSFLQWLDADRAGLPDEYCARLERALDRFGVRGLGHTPELEAALMWLFRSFSRLTELSPVVLAILERRLAHRDALQSSADAEMRARLDRLATATQGRQQPVADLARDVRFHYFDEPPIEAAAAEMYGEMADHLAHLAAHPDTADREERIARLVWCPHPMRSMLLASWMAHDADVASTLRQLLLEIHLRRYYRTREIGVINSEQCDRFLVAAVDYGHDHESVHVVAGYLPLHDSVVVVTGAAGSIVSAITADLAAASGGTFHLLDLTPTPDPADPDLEAFRADRNGLKVTIAERMKAAGEHPTPVTIERELARFERLNAALTAIQSVEAAGGTVHYHSVDLTDADAVATAIDDVRRLSGRIDVLLHAAGLEISRNLPEKEPREYDLVFDVKSDGWFNVFHAAQDMEIGATVVFSSVAGRFGNQGQTDYSAANDLLCKITSNFRRSRPETRGLALDWTAWGGIGMATRGSIPKIMEMAGVQMLPPEAGVAWIRRELVSSEYRGEVIVAGALGMMAAEYDDRGGVDLTSVVGDGADHGPMIGHATVSVHNGVVVETTLDPLQQPFLHDHRIDGTPVLPGVMGMEAFAETARLLAPDHHVLAVEDVSFAAPLKFYRDEPRTLTVQAVLTPDGDGLEAQCTLSAERQLPGHDEPQRTVHFTGRVRLGPEAPATEQIEPPGDPTGSTLDAEQVYSFYFHGPAYQVVSEAWRDGDASVATLMDPLPDNHVPPEQPLATAPRLIELCFQTAGLWQAGLEDRLALPMRVGRARW